MFVIKFALSPEIPLATVCWLCVTSRLAWRPCRVTPDTHRQQTTATFKENFMLFDRNFTLIRNWILQSQFHRSMESFTYKRQNLHLLLYFERIWVFSSLILLRRSNHLILWRPHFLLLAILLDVSENAYNTYS